MMSPRSLIAWAWTLVVLGVCWTPRQFVPTEDGLGPTFLAIPIDKLAHFLLFAGFACLWAFATRGRKLGWVLAASVALAAITEAGQMTSFVHRDAEWSDGFADVLGALAGMPVGWAVARHWRSIVRTPSAETP